MLAASPPQESGRTAIGTGPATRIQLPPRGHSRAAPLAQSSEKGGFSSGHDVIGARLFCGPAAAECRPWSIMDHGMMPRFRGQGAKQAFSQVTVRRSLVSWVQADLGAPHDRVDPISCSNFKLLLSRTTAELLLSCATVRRLAAHTPHAWLVPAPGRVHNDSIGWTGRSAAGPQTDTVTVTYGRSARAPWNQIRAAVSAQGGSAAQGIGGTNSEKKSDPRRPRGVADTAEAGPRVPTRSGTRDGLVGVRGSRPLSGRPNAVVRARLAPGTSHHARASQAASPAKTLTVGCEPVRPPTTDRARTLGGTRMVSCGSSRERNRGCGFGASWRAFAGVRQGTTPPYLPREATCSGCGGGGGHRGSRSGPPRAAPATTQSRPKRVRRARCTDC